MLLTSPDTSYKNNIQNPSDIFYNVYGESGYDVMNVNHWYRIDMRDEYYNKLLSVVAGKQKSFERWNEETSSRKTGSWKWWKDKDNKAYRKMLLRSFGCWLKLNWIKGFSEEVGGVDEAGEEDNGEIVGLPSPSTNRDACRLTWTSSVEPKKSQDQMHIRCRQTEGEGTVGVAKVG